MSSPAHLLHHSPDLPLQRGPQLGPAGEVAAAAEDDGLRAQVYSQVLNKCTMYRITVYRCTCVLRTFTVVENSREEANWARNWSSSFYLDVKTSSFITQTEFYAYDIWNLTSGLGGLMGLFIGWSFLSIIFLVYRTTERVLGIFCKTGEKD